MAKIFTFNSTNVINYTICILLVHKIIISCITKYMTEPSMEMMTRLEAADQTHSSVFDQRSCKSRYGKMQQKGILSWAITRRQVSRDL